jgi:hypothetical protein
MLEVHAVVERTLDRDDVDVELIEVRQRRLVGLVPAGDALRRGAAPAGVAPDLALAAQPLDLGVERLDPPLGFIFWFGSAIT